MFVAYYVFLFKQKTAYEMRISDWSSDVCSSDLHVSIRRCRYDAATAQPRIGQPTGNVVIAITTQQHVIAQTTVDRVIATAADDAVVAGTTVEAAIARPEPRRNIRHRPTRAIGKLDAVRSAGHPPKALPGEHIRAGCQQQIATGGKRHPIGRAHV